MNEAGTPSLDSEARLDALADELARLHGLYDRAWENGDERSDTLTEIVMGQRLDPGPATYLACVLADLAAPAEENKCKQN